MLFLWISDDPKIFVRRGRYDQRGWEVSRGGLGGIAGGLGGMAYDPRSRVATCLRVWCQVVA